MDWKVFLTTFGVVFLAELGDKTQLTALALTSGNPQASWAVFLGSALALCSTSALAVVGGSFLSRFVPERYIYLASGVFFLLMGAVILWRLDWRHLF